MNETYKPNPGEIAGFDLFAYRLKDGKIKLQSGKILDDFPKEIEVINIIYTLEDIKKNPGNNIEWGIYV